MKYTVLAADDEAELLDALELYFEKEGIALIKTYDGVSALKKFKEHEVHLVLLDVMMPGMDGFAVLRKIRETSKLPAIMLTARDQDYDKILGLELGADDYITKPFNPLEVLARVKAQLRRSYDYHGACKTEEGVLTNGRISLYDNEGRASVAGIALELTSIEYKILQLFMAYPGRIYTKKQIFERAWGEESIVDESAVVMVHISNLRNKLRAAGAADCIKTVKGLGYRMEKDNEN